MLTELHLSRVVPVVAIDDPAKASDLASALMEGGIDTIEITLRTEGALQAVRNVKASHPMMSLGVGTIVSPDDVSRAVDAGADFLVSPALTPRLQDPLLKAGIPALPGTATPSEAQAAYEAGFEIVKLFPAEAVGGANLLKSIHAPLPHLRFMPTGGVKTSNLPDYAALPNVVAIGGSWVATRADIDAADWAGIAEKAAEALSIAG